ncbi:chromatin assembly factor 1 subunit A-domain-containing protein [Auriculariales sp. MPI-PUGE-AT-0066]|nr:chromatin assembly factor 1 subunit A-domain-containing protein [Auriculariales sp. MPI-PUGE-AT-0066]
MSGTTAPVKQQRKKDDSSATASLVDGKATIKQKALALDKSSQTMQEIVKFRCTYDQSNDPLPAIPDEHLPLIAKLAHERYGECFRGARGLTRPHPVSSMMSAGLARSIRKLLIPDSDSAAVDRCPPPIIEAALNRVADRVNYGLDSNVTSLCEWRWEVKDFDMLPAELREKLDVRKAERIKAKDTLKELFDALPADKREEFAAKKGRKSIAKDAKIVVSDVNQDSSVKQQEDEKQFTAVADPAQKEGSPVPEQENVVPGGTASPAAAVKKVKAEGSSKDAVKKAAKDKEKQDNKKSSAMMMSFFKKPAAPDHAFATADSSASIASTSGSENIAHNGRPSQDQPSDFAATFHPFMVRKGVLLAPVNRFATPAYMQATNRHAPAETNKDGVAVIDLCSDDDNTPRTPAQDVLKTFVASVPAQFRFPKYAMRGSRGHKINFGRSIRETIDKLNDAEVEDDENAIKRLLKDLDDRRRYPVKLLEYREDVRPPYWGTWSKSSMTVGPRAPFGKHDKLDYDYDSEGDWDEAAEHAEGVGEDVAFEKMSAGSDEDEEMERDDDLDSFFAPEDEDLGDAAPGEILDDDIFFAPSFGVPISKAESVAKATSAADRKGAKPFLTKKRKSFGKDVSDRKKKKRKVHQLVPWYRGPIYEDSEGQCPEVPGFKAHRIRLLNETPYPIDPFTWVPAAAAAAPKAAAPAAGAGAIASSSSVGAVLASQKHSLPEQHMPLLIQIIAANDTKLSTIIDKFLEQVADSKPKVFRTTVEATIRAICDRVGKKWVLKGEFVAPPA